MWVCVFGPNKLLLASMIIVVVIIIIIVVIDWKHQKKAQLPTFHHGVTEDSRWISAADAIGWKGKLENHQYRRVQVGDETKRRHNDPQSQFCDTE